MPVKAEQAPQRKDPKKGNPWTGIDAVLYMAHRFGFPYPLMPHARVAPIDPVLEAQGKKFLSDLGYPNNIFMLEDKGKPGQAAERILQQEKAEEILVKVGQSVMHPDDMDGVTGSFVIQTGEIDDTEGNLWVYRNLFWGARHEKVPDPTGKLEFLEVWKYKGVRLRMSDTGIRAVDFSIQSTLISLGAAIHIGFEDIGIKFDNYLKKIGKNDLTVNLEEIVRFAASVAS